LADLLLPFILRLVAAAGKDPGPFEYYNTTLIIIAYYLRQWIMSNITADVI
jgi:hypothetical protein